MAADRGLTGRSLSEIAAMATAAAEGAGCAHGMAQEAGLFARVLCAHGLPGADAVHRVLTGPRRCACAGGTGSGPDCGLAAAVRVLDGGGMPAGPVSAPILLAAPLLIDALAGRLSWQGASLETDRPVAARGAVLAPVGTVSWTQRPGTVPAGGTGPVDVADDVWAGLGRLAARTLVPESEASRRRGAGPAS
ncbi:MAG: DUF3726 domain-containing protein [Hasllibacter sp.]